MVITRQSSSSLTGETPPSTGSAQVPVTPDELQKTAVGQRLCFRSQKGHSLRVGILKHFYQVVVRRLDSVDDILAISSKVKLPDIQVAFGGSEVFELFSLDPEVLPDAPWRFC